jgi:hypothetical protein
VGFTSAAIDRAAPAAPSQRGESSWIQRPKNSSVSSVKARTVASGMNAVPQRMNTGETRNAIIAQRAGAAGSSRRTRPQKAAAAPA